MRSFLLAALAVLTIGLLDTRSAQATYWQCIGPDWVCNDARQTKKTANVAKANSAKKTKPAVASAYAQPGYSYGYSYPQQKSKKATKPAGYSSASPAAYGGSGGQSGMASYYWQPQKVASGGWFNPNAMTAAHKTLPFGTKVRVTHVGNGKSVTVTINDRGPYVKGRIIDLSSAAAGAIGMKGQGVARVQLAVLGK